MEKEELSQDFILFLL